jgi:DNA-binding ferritin-like protein (Dps family)
MSDAEKSGIVSKLIGDKRRWRAYRARVKQLPSPYRTAVDAVERYLNYTGGPDNADSLMTMFEDLAELFEQAAADGTPVREIVGADPVEFVETFVGNYMTPGWIAREQARLADAIRSVE